MFAIEGQLTSDHRQLVVPTLAEIIVVTSHRARLFYFDETDIHWCPDIGRVYQLPGAQRKVDSPGKNKVRYLLGSVQMPSGEGLFELYTHKRNQEVQQHLTHLIEMYPKDFCFVVWDNAPSHTTPQLWPFLGEHQDRLCMVPLPTYSPHLNLIEHLWKFMRDQMMRSYFYDSFKALCEALMQWLEHLPFERFQSVMGIKPQPQSVAA